MPSKGQITSTQAAILLVIIASVAGVALISPTIFGGDNTFSNLEPTCSELRGLICASEQVCFGSSIIASDSANCCEGYCSIRDGITKTEVKVNENGMPKLFINEEQYDSLFLEVYYHPSINDVPIADQPEYPSSKWISGWKKIIDEAVERNVTLIALQIYWSDLDKVLIEPDPIDANFNYSALDEVMDYAQLKGAYIVIELEQHMNHARWYRDKYKIPDGWEKNSSCKICSKDNLGVSYDDISDASEINREAFSGVIKSVVNRYRTHPALAGWASGFPPSGEDSYCPNYVHFASNIQGENEDDLDNLARRICDYSPVSTEKFKQWLIDKYGSEAKVSSAWGGMPVSFDNFQVPDRSQIFSEDSVFNNPYFGIDNICEDDETKMTKTGLDYCQFRIETRQSERLYYSKLFKSLDPNHILIMNMQMTNNTLNISEVDGVMWNAHLNFRDVVQWVGDEYLWNMEAVGKLASYGKLAIVATETKPELDSMEENTNYLIATGQGIKCDGGVMGYTTDLSPGVRHFLPVWAGENQMEALDEIQKYVPTLDCECEVISEVMNSNRCLSEPRLERCSVLDAAYEKFCGIEPPADGSKGGTGYCGDGECSVTEQQNQNCPQDCHDRRYCGDHICDDFERSSGMCPQDCF